MKRWLLTGAIVTTVAGSGCAMNPAPYFSNPFAAATATDSPARFDQKLSLARLHERQDRTDEAVEIYRQVLAEDPEQPLANHRLGVIAAEQGDLDGAIRYFAVAQRRGGNDAELLADLGYALYLKDDLAEAENVLRRAAAAAPQNGRAKNNLAIVLGEQGRFDESLEKFREVVTEAQAHANVAYLQTQCGRHHEALEHYHRAVELDPDLRPAGEALVQLEMRRRQAQQVAANAQRAQQIAANVPPTPPQAATPANLQIPKPPVEAAPSQAAVAQAPAGAPVPGAPTAQRAAPASAPEAAVPSGTTLAGSPAPARQSAAAPATAPPIAAQPVAASPIVSPPAAIPARPPAPVAAQPLPIAAQPLPIAAVTRQAASPAPKPVEIVATPVAAPVPVEAVAAGSNRPRSKGVSIRMTDESNRQAAPAATAFSVPTPTENVAYRATSGAAIVQAEPLPMPVATSAVPVAAVRPIARESAGSKTEVEFIPLTPAPATTASKPVTMRIASGGTSAPQTAPAKRQTEESSSIRILNHDSSSESAGQPTVLRLSY